uniref:Uncharacterized protein n=1 Tax=viral metagenome TaxID=1070528 RepID=A0A6M3IEF4_9ZZZZ
MSKEKKKIDPVALTADFEARKKALETFGEYAEAMLKKESESVTKTFMQIAEETSKPIVTFVEELGCNISFRGLTVQDQLELDAIEEDLKRGNEMLYRMWKNGDSSVNRKTFDNMNADLKNAVLTAILRKQPFLPLKLPSELLQAGVGGEQSK